jgi:hypothetical protein
MKKVRTFVDQDLAKRLHHIDNLSSAVCEAVQISPDQHKVYAIKHMSQLTILTSDNILATRLRLEQDRVRRYLRDEHGIIIEKLRVKMNTFYGRTRDIKKVTRANVMSEQTSDIIASIAEDIEDPELKESLIRLARRTKS